MPKIQTRKKSPQIAENPIESKRGDFVSEVKNVSQDIMKSFWDDFLVGATHDVPEQLIGYESKKTGSESQVAEHDITESQEEEMVLFDKTENVHKELDRLHEEYFRKEVDSEELSLRKESEVTGVVEHRIKNILFELDKLKHSSEEVKVLLRHVKTDEIPVNPGRYHENFFEWLLLQIRNARQRIDEGLSWMSMFASKKRQKQYWNMYKKHGTTFGLSQERTAATQTG